MALSTVLTNVARKLIAKYGREVTHTTVTKGAYDPDTGTSTTETDETIIAFMSMYNTRDYNDNIEIGDVPMMTVYPISKDDKITISTKVYTVTLAQELPLEESIVLYQCNLRTLS